MVSHGAVVWGLVVAGIFLGYPGCGGQGSMDRPKDSATPSQPEVSAVQSGASLPQGTPAGMSVTADSGIASPIVSKEQLVEALKGRNPEFGGSLEVEIEGGQIVALEIRDPQLHDISPLAGMPLRFLDLAHCPVEDLRPLRGMPLQVLYLERTGVRDLRPLEGMPLVELRLNDTKVEDLRPLQRAPIRMLYLAGTWVEDLTPLAGNRSLEALWLNDTPVEDLRPLASCPNLISLTIAGTKVRDLTPLKGLRLERLHLARTPVEDLTPLRWLRLTRLVFNPSRIRSGLEEVRSMTTLREIGTSFGEEDKGRPDDLMPPAIFWEKYDAGDFR